MRWLVYEHMFASQLAWDEGLDEAQLAVATHGETPLVVVAGAGTGKTRALTSRVTSLAMNLLGVVASCAAYLRSSAITSGWMRLPTG